MLHREAERQRPALLAQGALAAPDAERPVDEAPLDAGRLGEGRRDRRVDLLVDARHARQDRRPHLGHRAGDVEGIGQERDRVPDVRPREVHQPAEVVGERQVEEHHVARRAVVGEVVDGRDHRVVVAVADHAALGRPGRPRRVDVREEIVLVDRGDRLVERPGARVPVRATLLLQGGEVGEREHLGEPRERRASLLDLGPLGIVLAEDAHRLRVLEHVVHVLRRRVRVDRGPDRADVGQREVEQRPLERVAGEDAEGVALADASREEAVREVLDALRRLGPGHLPPAGVLLDQIGDARVLAPRRRARGAESCGFQPSPGQL